MRTLLLTRDSAVSAVCDQLADLGAISLKRLADLSELLSFSPDHLAQSVLLIDRGYVELMSSTTLKRLAQCSLDVLVHSSIIPPPGFISECNALRLDLVIGPPEFVLKRRLSDSVRLAGLEDEQSRWLHAADSPAEPDDPDRLRQQVRYLEVAREELSSVLATMSTLSRLSTEISTLNLDEIISVCVSKIPRVVQARYASFYLHDYDQDSLRLTRHNHGHRIDETVAIRPDSSSAMVHAVLTRKPLLVTDFDSFERTHGVKVEHPYAARYASKSCLIVPMLAGDRVVAVLNLADKTDGGPFSRTRDLPPMEQLSALVGAAIRNYQLYREVSLQARTDAMTGFANHQTFYEELDRETSRAARYEGPLSLMMTDIDNFKNFNDLYGHQVGDDILRRTSAIVRAHIRDTDLPARYGGDEFAVILPHAGADHSRVVAERIRQVVQSTEMSPSDAALAITLSIGLAQDRPGMSVADFVHEADTALYQAKSSGRNRVVPAV